MPAPPSRSDLLAVAAARGGPVPSPCVSLCRMDAATALCQGCARTIDEIVAWGTMADEERLAVWDRIAQRRAAPG